MLCNETCPRGTQCKPVSNVVATDGSSFCCVGLHHEVKEEKADIFRHCFKTPTTDSCYDYDEYDLISVVSIFSEALMFYRFKVEKSTAFINEATKLSTE